MAETVSYCFVKISLDFLTIFFSFLKTKVIHPQLKAFSINMYLILRIGGSYPIIIPF